MLEVGLLKDAMTPTQTVKLNIDLGYLKTSEACQRTPVHLLDQQTLQRVVEKELFAASLCKCPQTKIAHQLE
jgi:hypothetical protein